jgi:hypothetical protein
LCLKELLPHHGECWPLDSEQKSVILKNYSKIADILEVDDDLNCEMLSRNCLTLTQLTIIENTNDRIERNKKLLNILLRSSRATLKLFIECLETTQRHVVPLMSENTGKVLLVYDVAPLNFQRWDPRFEIVNGKHRNSHYF